MLPRSAQVERPTPEDLLHPPLPLALPLPDSDRSSTTPNPSTTPLPLADRETRNQPDISTLLTNMTSHGIHVHEPEGAPEPIEDGAAEVKIKQEPDPMNPEQKVNRFTQASLNEIRDEWQRRTHIKQEKITSKGRVCKCLFCAGDRRAWIDCMWPQWFFFQVSWSLWDFMGFQWASWNVSDPHFLEHSAHMSGLLTPEKLAKPVQQPPDYDGRMDQELAYFDGLLHHSDNPPPPDLTPPSTPKRANSGPWLCVGCVSILESQGPWNKIIKCDIHRWKSLEIHILNDSISFWFELGLRFDVSFLSGRTLPAGWWSHRLWRKQPCRRDQCWGNWNWIGLPACVDLCCECDFLAESWLIVCANVIF